jgi:hypothetical protein
VDKLVELPRPDTLFVWSFYQSPRCEEFFERLWIYACPESGGAARDGPRSGFVGEKE